MQPARTEDLARSSLFGSLSPDELRQAAQGFTVRSYPKGAIIVSEGDRLQFFSILLAGRIKFFWRDETGWQVDLAIIKPPEDFAAQGLGGEPMLNTLIALEDVRLVSIPIAGFENLLLQHPKLALAYLKRVVGLFRRCTAGRKSFAMEDVYGRIAELLLASATESEGRLVTERLTQAEIGQRVGATREMVGRILRDLSRGGYIEIDRGRIAVLRMLPRRW
jgi:CRP/FNR family cyclic AMP-dependent transcriptional regulator